MAYQHSYGEEPSLSETLDDPIVQQVMLSDGVSRHELLRLLAAVRRACPDRRSEPFRRSPN